MNQPPMRILEKSEAGSESDLRSAIEFAKQVNPPESLDDAGALAMADLAFRAEVLSDYEVCSSMYRKVLQYNTSDTNIPADAWFRLGLCRERLGDYRDALEAFRHAIRLGHDWPRMIGLAKFHLARLLVSAEEYDAAAGLFEELASQGPHPDIRDEDVQIEHSQCLVKLGRLEEARTILERMRVLRPESDILVDADQLLVGLYERIGDLVAAAECYRRIIQAPTASVPLKRAAASRLSSLAGRPATGNGSSTWRSLRRVLLHR